MPYEWVTRPLRAPEQSGAFAPSGDAPLAELHLWPHRSLPRKGFVLVIGLTAGLMALPLIRVLGSPVLWGLLPFLLAAVWGLWIALERSYRDGEMIEELRLWPERITLERRGPRGRHASWEANPYWTTVRLHPSAGPVPNYLTLKGGGREVEIGAFLSEDERRALFCELESLLGGR